MKRIVKIVILTGVIALLAGCNLADNQTKSECLDDFFNKAQNSQWTTMYEEIHPDNSNRNSYKTGDTFDTLYDPSVTYSIASKNDDTFYVNVKATAAGTSYVEKFVFRIEETTLLGDDTWLIYSFTANNQTGGTY